MQDLHEVLKSNFGYDSFRDNQEQIISKIISGKDALIVMPTGGGKSLCYQLPALALAGTALVVSPLIALMEDQVTALQENGISAAYLNSTTSYQDRLHIEDSFIDGTLDILYMAPERLLQPETLLFLKSGRLNLIAIDEAHCVSQWGHDFRPEYRQLNSVRRAFSDIPAIALTATADPVTQNDIVQQLELHDAERFICGFDRPNITYSIRERQNPKKQLLGFLSQHRHESGIVYCSTRNDVDEYTAFLQDNNYNARAYHAGLSTDKRSRALTAFQNAEEMIIVATIAFGMGIDKPDVRFVAHLNLPKSMESYYQETGRAGRDGEPATAWMIYGMKDIILQKSFITQSEGSDEFKRIATQKLNSLLAFCETAQCRRQALLNYFGEKHHENCGNCDNCIQPPETYDATVLAQKALSNVYRTGSRFSITHLADVLLGKKTDRILQFRHDRVSTFGIGSDLDANDWKNLYRQLAVAGYCEIDIENYNAVKLNAASYRILKNETTFFARKISRLSEEKATKTRKKSKITAESLNTADQKLFDKLTELNAELAAKHGVPKYVIFNRASLAEMAVNRPESPTEFLKINGVGEVKLKNYGSDFINLIRNHSS